MVEKSKTEDLVRRASLADGLRQELEQTLNERIDRFMKIRHQPIIRNTEFALASAECIILFRDGSYYGCISLCQAVGEALIRFMCDSNSFNPTDNYEENLRLLHKRGFIGDKFESDAKKLWKNRNDYHHLNPNIETDLKELEQLAYSKVVALAELERWVFDGSFQEGKFQPKNPKYWGKSKDGRFEAFLRIAP